MHPQLKTVARQKIEADLNSRGGELVPYQSPVGPGNSRSPSPELQVTNTQNFLGKQRPAAIDAEFRVIPQTRYEQQAQQAANSVAAQHVEGQMLNRSGSTNTQPQQTYKQALDEMLGSRNARAAGQAARGAGVGAVVEALGQTAIGKVNEVFFGNPSLSQPQIDDLARRTQQAFPEADGFRTRTQLQTEWGQNAAIQRLRGEELRQEIERQQSRPEVRKKLYDRDYKEPDYDGLYKQLQDSPFGQGKIELQRYHDDIPGYAPDSTPGYDPGFTGKVYDGKYPPFQPVVPAGEEFVAPSPEEFLIPPLDPAIPRNEVLRSDVIRNGNLPDSFAPSPQSPNAQPPGSVPGKIYAVTTQNRTTQPPNPDAVFPPSTNNYPGAIGGKFEDANGIGFTHSISPQNPQGVKQYQASRAREGNRENSFTISVAPAPGQLPDPYVPSAPSPAPTVDRNPDTGRPNLPNIEPSLRTPNPTRPDRSPSPSPLRSPSGNRSPSARPDASPVLTPNNLPDFAPFELPQLNFPTNPFSGDNPLVNPTLPFNNPGTQPTTGNPATTINLPSTGVTINGDLVQDGNTPIFQIDKDTRNKNQPSPQTRPITIRQPSESSLTNVTINGEPIDIPKQVNKPDGTLDPNKVHQQQEQKKPLIPIKLPRKTCDDPCIQGLHDKIDSQQVMETIEYNVFKECNKDTKEALYEKRSLSVSKTEALIVKTTLDRIAESEGQKCKDDCDCYAAIPDWWQIRLGADIPQAVVQYAEIKPDGKFGSPKYAVSIPHYAKSRETTLASDFPTYIKGQRMGILTLRDNSKLIVNADGNEAERVIKQLENLIEPLWLTGAIYSDGKRKGTALKTIRVAPRIVKFFPTGQTDTKPKWIKYF